MRKSMILDLLNAYSESFKLAYVGYSYKELRRLHGCWNSIIDANAIYDARIFRRAVLATHNYPKQLNPQLFLRKQDFRISGSRVSIVYKPKERLTLGVYPSEKQLKLMDEANTKGARMVEKDGRLFLNLVLEKEVQLPRWQDCQYIVGVDIGINYIAVCSAMSRDGKFTNPLFFKGGEWKHICDRKRKTRRMQEFKHLSNRQQEILHTVSKRIVDYAKQFPKPIIVLENLGHFENRTKNKRWNFLLGNWARRKLQQMIEYKAHWEGIPVVYVNPAYSSLHCHYCGSKGEREGLLFKCSNCGRQYNADANASMNIAKRFAQLLNEPKAMIGERSDRDMSSLPEGETCLPSQTHTQPGNGSQMKGMKAIRTLRLPVAVGSGKEWGERCW